MSHAASTIIRPLFLAAALLSFGSLAAQAQTKTETPAAKPAAPKKASSPWLVQCGSIGEKKQRFCRIQNSIKFKKTGQRLLGVVIQAQTTEPKIAMQLSLPHGLYLPAGTIYKIDEGKEARLVIETCNPEGCYASTGMDEKLIEAMKKGKEMLVAFQANTNKEQITIPVSLKGFAAAFDKVKLDDAKAPEKPKQ